MFLFSFKKFAFLRICLCLCAAVLSAGHAGRKFAPRFHEILRGRDSQVFVKWCQQLVRRPSGCPEGKGVICSWLLDLCNAPDQLSKSLWTDLAQFPMPDIDAWAVVSALSLLARNLYFFNHVDLRPGHLMMPRSGCFFLALHSSFPDDVSVCRMEQSTHTWDQQQLRNCRIFLSPGKPWNLVFVSPRKSWKTMF